MLNKVGRLHSVLHFAWASVVFLLTMLLVLPFIVLSTLIFPGKRGHDLAFVFIRLWAWLFSIFSFFYCEVRNPAVKLNSTAQVYISNHTSFLDSVMLVRALPESFKPLGKMELANVPIFGLIYRKVVVMIDRTSKESREKCVSELKKELARGQSILIFPEGTMNRSTAPLKEFYDGAFRIAVETQTPLAPVVLINGDKLLPRTTPYLKIRPGKVKVVFGTPIEVQGLTLADVPRLKKQAFDQMEAIVIAHTG